MPGGSGAAARGSGQAAMPPPSASAAAEHLDNVAEQYKTPLGSTGCRICFIWVGATPPRGVAGRSRIRAKDLAQFLPRPSASGGKERMSLRLLVKWLGRQVDAIRPHDGSCLRIDPNPGEVGRIV